MIPEGGNVPAAKNAAPHPSRSGPTSLYIPVGVVLQSPHKVSFPSLFQIRNLFREQCPDDTISSSSTGAAPYTPAVSSIHGTGEQH